jgi:hypothetical protein
MDLISTLTLKARAVALVTISNLYPIVMYGVKAPFTPSLDLQTGDAQLADFGGAANWVGQITASTICFDPVQNAWIMGFNSDNTGCINQANSLVNLPQTIYGVVCVSNISSKIVVSELLAAEVRITGVGEGYQRPWRLLQLRTEFLV